MGLPLTPNTTYSANTTPRIKADDLNDLQTYVARAYQPRRYWIPGSAAHIYKGTGTGTNAIVLAGDVVQGNALETDGTFGSNVQYVFPLPAIFGDNADNWTLTSVALKYTCGHGNVTLDVWAMDGMAVAATVPTDTKIATSTDSTVAGTPKVITLSSLGGVAPDDDTVITAKATFTAAADVCWGLLVTWDYVP